MQHGSARLLSHLLTCTRRTPMVSGLVSLLDGSTEEGSVGSPSEAITTSVTPGCHSVGAVSTVVNVPGGNVAANACLPATETLTLRSCPNAVASRLSFAVVACGAKTHSLALPPCTHLKGVPSDCSILNHPAPMWNDTVALASG